MGHQIIAIGRTWLASVALLLTTFLVAGCGLGGKRVAMAPHVISVTNDTPAQATQDRQQIVTLLDVVAAKHGLTRALNMKGDDVVALYFSPEKGLGLSLSALAMDERVVTVTVAPVALGLASNPRRQQVITAVDTALQQAFGGRFVPAQP